MSKKNTHITPENAKVGLEVRRSTGLKGSKEDEEIFPPKDLVGTIVAWTDMKKKMFGKDPKKFKDQLAWEGIAIVEFKGDARAYRIGFMGEYWLEFAELKEGPSH
jgi:hypothetical protein